MDITEAIRMTLMKVNIGKAGQFSTLFKHITATAI